MTSKPVVNPWRRKLPWPVAICVGLFMVADLLLIGGPWFLDHKRLVIAMAVPISQCSLAAVWAATSRASLYLRFAVPLLATIGSWYVLTRILPWGTGEPASASWTIVFATQTLAIVLTVNLYERVRNLRQQRVWRDGSEASDSVSPLAFDLRTLMLWTTVIAFAFGFIQFARAKWQWTFSIADWEFWQAMPVIGVFDAALALCWLWALTSASWRRRIAKIFAVMLLVVLLGCSLPPVVAWVVGVKAMETSESLVFTAAQSILIAGSLAFVAFAARRTACKNRF